MTVKEVKGVGAKTTENLNEVGINTVEELAETSEDFLIEEAGIKQGTASKILNNARKQLRTHGTGFSKGDTVDEKQSKLQKVTTGSKKIDKMLGGGVPCEYITEFHGENGSGKSQTAMSLAVNAQLPEDEGGMNKQAIYIDTESSLVMDRFKEIAEAKDLDADKVLENIFIAQTIDSNDLLEKVKNARQICSNEDIGIIIIDSISSHYRAEYGGRDELTERQESIGEVIKNLRELTRAHGVAVVYTNQVYHNPGGGYGDNTVAWGGNIIGHNSTFRVYLEDRQGKGWAATLKDSPGLPYQQVYFEIDESGITDKE